MYCFGIERGVQENPGVTLVANIGIAPVRGLSLGSDLGVIQLCLRRVYNKY